MKCSKIEPLIRNNFNEKDQALMEKFFSKRDFTSMWEITVSELKKESMKSTPGNISERSCNLQELYFHLTKQLESLGEIYEQ